VFPDGLEKFRDQQLAAKWETIRNVRRVVTGALELERAAKRIGSSLEASPLVYVSDRKIFDTLFDVDLAEVVITSNAMATNEEAPAGAFRLNDVPGVAVVVEKAQGIKCARSWKILPSVGEDPEYPDVSPRDAQALREWQKLGASFEQPVRETREPPRPVEPMVKQPLQQPKEVTEDAAVKIAAAGKKTPNARAQKTRRSDKAKGAGTARSAAGAKTAKKAKRARKAKSVAKTNVAGKSKKTGKGKKAAKPAKGAKKKTAAKKATKKKAARKPAKGKPATRARKKKKKAR
jgi:isoleucyl-tRNA synthetase